MSYEDYQAVYRIIVVGDASVGKTCMIESFVKDSRDIVNSKPTIGVQHYSKTIQMANHDLVRMQIWDTAGQQNYRSLGAVFIKKANAALIVFDITNRKSFNSVNYWFEQIKKNAIEQNLPILLVGNKLDKAQFRAVSVDEAEDLAKKYRISYREATSTDPNLLKSIFKQALESIKFVKQKSLVVNLALNRDQQELYLIQLISKDKPKPVKTAVENLILQFSLISDSKVGYDGLKSNRISFQSNYNLSLHQKIQYLFAVEYFMQLELQGSPLIIGYYPFRAKAQILRLLCQYLQIPYQDRFFTPDQWNKFKKQQLKQHPIIDMPFIIHQGFIICGTHGPARYIIELANNNSLLGKTQKDRIKIDQLKNRKDLKDAMLGMITKCRENGSCEQMKKYIEKFYQTKIEPILIQFETQCCQNNFYFGYLTIFDFVIYEIMNLFKQLFAHKIVKLAKLSSLRDRVAQIPQIKAYELSSRAVTEFCPVRFFNKFKQQRINANRGISCTNSTNQSGMDLE